MTRPPSDPTRPVAVGFRTHAGRLEVELGDRRVDAGRVGPGLNALLVAGLEEVLGGRSTVGRQHRVALDRDGTRRLGVRQRADDIELSLLDVHDRPVIPPHPLPVAGFARAVRAFVAPPDGDDSPGPALDALVDWAEALDGRLRAAPAIANPPAAPDAAHRPPVQRLPVGDLYHLAYRRAWRHEAPGLTEMTANETSIAVFDSDGLRLLDRADGALRHAHRGLRPLMGPEPMRCAVDADEHPIRLDASGAQQWRGAAPAGPAPLQGLYPTPRCVLALTAGREAYGLDPQTGAVRWRYETHYGEILGAAVSGRLGWLTAEDGLVHGLDLVDGARRFVVNPGGPDGQPHLTDAGLLVGLDDPAGSRLTCLDPMDGRPRWSTVLPGHLGRPPMAIPGALVTIIEHGADPMVVVLDPAGGEIRWSRVLDGPDLPVARLLDGALCLKHIDGSAVALETGTGALRWLLPGDDPELTLRSNPPPVGCRGLVLVPGTTIRAIDPADGRVVHRIDCGELVPDRMHVWPEGDLVIAEDEAVARYLLGGHIARVR